MTSRSSGLSRRGGSGQPFVQAVVELVARHDVGVDRSAISRRADAARRHDDDCARFSGRGARFEAAPARAMARRKVCRSASANEPRPARGDHLSCGSLSRF